MKTFAEFLEGYPWEKDYNRSLSHSNQVCHTIHKGGHATIMRGTYANMHVRILDVIKNPRGDMVKVAVAEYPDNQFTVPLKDLRCEGS